MMLVYQLLKWTDTRPAAQEGDEASRASVSTESTNVDETVKAQFDAATAFMPGVIDRIAEPSRLYLYARYKQAVEGPADVGDRPSIIDVRGRYKFDAWLSVRHLSRESAMRAYVEKLLELDVGFDLAKLPAKRPQGFGPKPSTPAAGISDDEEASELAAELAAWFSAVYLEDLDKMREMLSANRTLLEERNESELNALHWASDRGRSSIVKFLLDEGADVNALDGDGQTPLHYAVSCSHRDIVGVLLAAGGDPAIADFEGNCSLDIATDALILQWLEAAADPSSTVIES